MLGMSRAIGETMVVLMVAGGAAIIPHSIFSPVRPMPSSIAAEMADRRAKQHPEDEVGHRGRHDEAVVQSLGDRRFEALGLRDAAGCCAQSDRLQLRLKQLGDLLVVCVV